MTLNTQRCSVEGSHKPSQKAWDSHGQTGTQIHWLQQQTECPAFCHAHTAFTCQQTQCRTAFSRTVTNSDSHGPLQSWVSLYMHTSKQSSHVSLSLSLFQPHTHHLRSVPNRLLSVHVFWGTQPISFQRDTALVCKTAFVRMCATRGNKWGRALALCYSDNGIVLRP